MAKKSGLGRGLSALIPTGVDQNESEDRFQEIDLDLLDPNPEQPRHTFHEDQLSELSESIRHNGVIQPIIVTPSGDRFVVIAGERRWRATKLAGFEKIPAVVREVEEGQMLSFALLENIQRSELNPIEEALAYRKLLENNNITQESLAEKLGKNRATISNTIRLLKLPARIKNMIQDQKLSFGHARCLVTVEDGATLNKLAEACVEKQWSVRELERRVQRENEAGKKAAQSKDDAIRGIERRLSEVICGKVSIAGNGKKGKITIAYGSENEFSEIMKVFLKSEGVEMNADG